MDQPAEEITAPNPCRGRRAEGPPSVWAVEADATVRGGGYKKPLLSF